MKINWFGSFSQGQGYSGSAENMLIALSRKGIDVRTATFSKDNKKNITKEGLNIKNKPFELGNIGIAYGFPNSFSSLMLNKVKVGFTMFETTRLPNGQPNVWCGSTGNWLDAIKNLDMLLTPSTFCRDIMIKEGAKVPIEIVPLGVDTEKYKYIERPKRKKFTFLMLGTLTIRKNPGYVISAFLDLFKNNEDVELVLKTQDGTIGHVQMPYKNLKIIDERTLPEKMMKYYEDADCFVFPSRGEGFGLPPLEAMATGLPTIFSANTGMLDFADDKYCYPIRKMTEQKAIHFPKDWGDVGQWFDPDYQELKNLMKYVYEHREEAKEKGRMSAEWVKTNWSFDKSADKLIEILNKLERR